MAAEQLQINAEALSPAACMSGGAMLGSCSDGICMPRWTLGDSLIRLVRPVARSSCRRTARAVLPRGLAEPATARPVQRALFGIAQQTGDLLQMQSRHREVARGMRSALTVDDVVAAHALGGKLSLQSSRMQRELVGDGLGATLTGRQQPPGQFGHAFGQRGSAWQ